MSDNNQAPPTEQPQSDHVDHDASDEIATAFDPIRKHLVAFQQLVRDAAAWGQCGLTHVRLIDENDAVLDLSDVVAIDERQAMVGRLRAITDKRFAIAAALAIPDAPEGHVVAIDVFVELPGLLEGKSRAQLTADGLGPFEEWTFGPLGPRAWVVLAENFTEWGDDYIASIASVDLDLARERAEELESAMADILCADGHMEVTMTPTDANSGHEA